MWQKTLPCCCVTISTIMLFMCSSGLHKPVPESEGLIGESAGIRLKSPTVVQSKQQPNESWKAIIGDILIQAKSQENTAHLPLELLVSHRQQLDAAETSQLNACTTDKLIQSIKAYQAKLSIQVNNLANADSLGFRRRRCDLEECVLEKRVSPNAERSSIAEVIGSGTRVVGVEREFSQGSIRETGIRSNVAIVGQGFFKFQNEKGDIVYSRRGDLNQTADGTLAIPDATSGEPTQTMLTLLPLITVTRSARDVSVEPTGQVSVLLDGSFKTAGTIQLTSFSNPDGLKSIDGVFFRETEESGRATTCAPGDDGAGILRGGVSEGSNVDPIDEASEVMTTMKTLRLLRQLLKLPE